jgi:hypothetical protein
MIHAIAGCIVWNGKVLFGFFAKRRVNGRTYVGYFNENDNKIQVPIQIKK